MIVKSGQVMHEIIYRAVELLNENNAQECIDIVTDALEHDEGPYLRKNSIRGTLTGLKSSFQKGNDENPLSNLLQSGGIGNILSPPNTPLYGGEVSGVGNTFKGSSTARKILNDSSILSNTAVNGSLTANFSTHPPACDAAKGYPVDSDSGLQIKEQQQQQQQHQPIPTGTVVAESDAGKELGKGSVSTPQKYAGVIHPTLSYHSGALANSTPTATVVKEKNCFNRIQLLRLLLIRCDAYSMLKQYKKALSDAMAAVEVSEGRSVQAYFYLGREYRRFLQIPEAVAAFDTAEALLKAIQQADRSGHSGIISDLLPVPQSDEDFWAQRGFREADVRRLHLRREQFEAAAHPSSTPSSVLSSVARGGGGQRGSKSLELDVKFLQSKFEADLNSAASTKQPGALIRSDGVGGGPDSSTWMAALFGGQSEQPPLGTSPTTEGIPRRLSVVSSVREDDTATEWDNARCLRVLGMSAAELASWRRRAREARSVLAVEGNHTVAFPMHGTMLTLLGRRITAVRGGVVLSIENGLNVPMQFLGCVMPDAMFYMNFDFPAIIQEEHCGLAMLQPRNWGGYSGSICYALGDKLCCFFYFERNMMGTIKFGVHFHEVLTDVLRHTLHQTSGLVVRGVRTEHADPATPTLKGNVLLSSAAAHANRLVALNAQQTPPTSSWVTTHTARLSNDRIVKASGCMCGNNRICFAISEIASVKLKDVELLPALEYAGPLVLKKLSVVSRHYRELVNNLPPPMFFGGGRHAYPDYCTVGDGYSSPWVLRDEKPVTWRIVYKSRSLEQEEFHVVSENGSQRAFLYILTSAQTKVASTVYYGDCHCTLLTIRESRIPFKSTLYFTTLLGRTFANCSVDLQERYTLTHTVGGKDELLYSARSPSADESAFQSIFSAELGSQKLGTRVPHTEKNGMPGFLPMMQAKEFLVWRPAQANGVATNLASMTPTKNGSVVAAKVMISPLGSYCLNKKSVVGEMTFLPGADMLLLSVMAFCMIRW